MIVHRLQSGYSRLFFLSKSSILFFSVIHVLRLPIRSDFYPFLLLDFPFISQVTSHFLDANFAGSVDPGRYSSFSSMVTCVVAQGRALTSTCPRSALEMDRLSVLLRPTLLSLFQRASCSPQSFTSCDFPSALTSNLLLLLDFLYLPGHIALP